MNSEKQLLANQQNAQLSTGPKSAKGKAIIATNAIKHGIFTKDLIVTSAHGMENEEEYLEMLTNLEACLNPQNQMESLLVEKIAIDFWRLKRVIRFEAGSIAKYLEIIFDEFYSPYSRKKSEEIDKEIQVNKENIIWIDAYVECLKKEVVSFDQPIWKGDDLESDILEDFCLIIRFLDDLTHEEKDMLLYSDNNFEKLKAVLAHNGYSSKTTISTKLIELYVRKLKQLEDEIEELEHERLTNIQADKLNGMLGTIPSEDSSNKILKYERSIQKSIFQNLFLLKKLQGTC